MNDFDVITGTAMRDRDTNPSIWRQLSPRQQSLLAVLNKPMTVVDLTNWFQEWGEKQVRDSVMKLASAGLIVGNMIKSSSPVVWSRSDKGTAVLTAAGCNTVTIPHFGKTEQKLRQ